MTQTLDEHALAEPTTIDKVAIVVSKGSLEGIYGSPNGFVGSMCGLGVRGGVRRG